MATKASLTLTAALLVALVSLASATTFTTTVTTTSAEEDTNPSYQRCRQQLQGRRFRPCQRYFESGPYADDEEVLEMSTQQYLNECCHQLRQMDRQQCGCEAIKHAVRQAQQADGGAAGYRGDLSEQIYEKARSLPRMCGLRQQQCQLSLVFV